MDDFRDLAHRATAMLNETHAVTQALHTEYALLLRTVIKLLDLGDVAAAKRCLEAITRNLEGRPVAPDLSIIKGWKDST